MIFRASIHCNSSSGFILLEVLIAMTIVMGSWMVSTHAYQKLALNLSQQESKRSQLRKEFDSYEMEMHSRPHSHQLGALKDDAARVLSGNDTLRTAVKSIVKGQRSSGK